MLRKSNLQVFFFVRLAAESRHGGSFGKVFRAASPRWKEASSSLPDPEHYRIGFDILFTFATTTVAVRAIEESAAGCVDPGTLLGNYYVLPITSSGYLPATEFFTKETRSWGVECVIRVCRGVTKFGIYTLKPFRTERID